LSIRDEETSSMTSVLRAIPKACGGQAGRLAAVAVLAASLAGCYTARDTVADVPRDYRQRHPITLQEGDRTVQVFVGANRGGLAPAQRADVLAFANAWKRDATGGVIIEVPSGTPNERAAADSMREIQSILAAAGVPGDGIAVRPYRPTDPAKLATIRLNYPRITAEAGPCGLWPNDLGSSDLENRPHWNLGCATQRNLAAMVENPADLVQPRGEGPAYRGRRTVVLDKYRKGESTATVYPKEDQGKISDVGK
jgi:pilus assembly protein CpaD